MIILILTMTGIYGRPMIIPYHLPLLGKPSSEKVGHWTKITSLQLRPFNPFTYGILSPVQRIAGGYLAHPKRMTLLENNNWEPVIFTVYPLLNSLIFLFEVWANLKVNIQPIRHQINSSYWRSGW
jgi:hypothetical protein